MDLLTLYNQRDGIIDFAKQRLNDDQQRIFVEHFMMCFTNGHDEFPIDGDMAIEWLGYEKKHKFKEAITKILVEDVEYKLFFTHVGEKYETRGRPSDIIKLSIDGFKKMELYAQTEKGNRVRSYYIRLEKLVYEYGMYQHKLALEEANRKIEQARQETENIKYVLEAERANIARKLRRKVDVESMKDVVYLYQESNDIIKVGEAMNMKNREDTHRSSSYSSRMVYAKQCTNRKLLEKVVHHILDQYRLDPQREWFKVSFEVAKEALDTAQLFLDGMVDHCEQIHQRQLFARMKDLIYDTCLYDVDKTSVMQEENETIEESISPPPPPPLPEFDINDIMDVKNPLDFNKFIDECCILGDDQYAISAEVFGAHRFWGRCCLKTTHDGLYEYLQKRFKTVKRHDPKTNAVLASFKGISLKPLEIKKDKPESDIDMFIDEVCTVGYSYRISCRQIYKAFEDWKRSNNPEYMLSSEENKRLCEAFSKRFVPASVYVDKQSHRGYFCVSLKGSESLSTGLKLAQRLKKPVMKIDMETKQVVETFESLQDAARSIGRCVGNLSSDIKYKKPFAGYFFQYINQNDNAIPLKPT